MNLYQLLLPLLVLFSPLETNINQTPAPLDYIASEIQEEWNNSEEYRKKQELKRRQEKDAYYAQDAYTRKANQARQAGYLAGEMIQLVFGPTEIIEGVSKLSKLSKLPKLLGKNKILNTLAKAGIAEEKIAEFDRLRKIPDKVKRTQALNQLLSKEKKIEKTLQKAGLLPKLSKNTNKLNKASKAEKLNKATKSGIKTKGRAGRQARLRELSKDPKVSSADRGWIKSEMNQIKRGKRKNIRNPPGKELAHKRGKEAAKGYSYKYSDLQDKDLHKLQHKHDKYGKLNKSPK